MTEPKLTPVSGGPQVEGASPIRPSSPSLLDRRALPLVKVELRTSVIFEPKGPVKLGAFDHLGLELED